MNLSLPAGWRQTASAFNWTREVRGATRTAHETAVDIVRDGISTHIEIEAGQIWRSFPVPTDEEVDRLRSDLEAAGGAVSIVGVSIDDWSSSSRRRTEQERLDFLLPQLSAASRLGADGVRLPIGQAGGALLERLLPHLHRFDLMLLEEIQGQQDPAEEPYSSAVETIATLDDPHVRVLIDLSLLMPSLPPSHLDRLEARGLSPALVDTLRTSWRDPGTRSAVREALMHEVPAPLRMLFMDLLVRFGSLSAADLRPLLPLTSGVHLKFWDLDDSEERISQPIREFAGELGRSGFRGTLCSEWGGHEWLEDDPEEMTRAHLELARQALSEGAAANAA